MAFIENNRIKIVLDTGEETTTAKEVWKNCLSTIKKNVSELEYRTWFKPIEAYDILNNTLKIRIPKNLSWDFIEQHYGSLLKKTLLSTLGPEAKLTYEIFEEETTPEIKFEGVVPEKIQNKKVKDEIVPDTSFES
ncbi:MAG: DnaA N-terminal domain-containing protein, partial [Candidatus Pacearchaeota archaeon]